MNEVWHSSWEAPGFLGKSCRTWRKPKYSAGPKFLSWESLPPFHLSVQQSGNEQMKRKPSEHGTEGTVKTLLRLLAATQSCWSEYPEIKR